MGEEQPAAGLSGRTLGSYRLIESLGTGGMGEVYLAEDVRLGRRVALKLLPPEFSEHPEKIQRFEREARAIASLNHPGIVTLHSIEEADGRRFLTMEHVEGQTLSSSIPPGGLPLGRFLSQAIALTDAVSAAHRQGIDGRLSAARAITEKALDHAESPDHRARVRLYRAEIAADLGQADDALAEIDLALAEKPQDPGVVAAAHSCRATCLARAGKKAAAKTSRGEVEKWLGSLPAPLAEPRRLQIEGELAWAMGKPARARELLARAAALLPEAGIESKAPATRIHFALGRAALEEGRVDEARRALERVVNGGTERLWEPIAYVRSLALLARLEEAAGHTERARRLYAQYLDHWADGEIDTDEVGVARRRLAALGGRLPRAA
jgi:tetratricopeptide (TPR) repeat protein